MLNKEDLLSIEHGIRILIGVAEDNLKFTEAKEWRAVLAKITLMIVQIDHELKG